MQGTSEQSNMQFSADSEQCLQQHMFGNAAASASNVCMACSADRPSLTLEDMPLSRR